jgi:hypothetical protein
MAEQRDLDALVATLREKPRVLVCWKSACGSGDANSIGTTWTRGDVADIIKRLRTQAPAPSSSTLSQVLTKVLDWAREADDNGDAGYRQAQDDVTAILASFAVRPLSEETT